MPEYLHPGVYIEETSYRGKPIQGVSTSTAGFVGAARKGAEGKPTFIPSFADFRRIFGDPVTGRPASATISAMRSRRSSTMAAPAATSCGRSPPMRWPPTVAIEQGTVLRLAPGVTVRGPTRTLRLNALRGVGVGSVLRIFTRPNATARSPRPAPQPSRPTTRCATASPSLRPTRSPAASCSSPPTPSS